MEMHTGFAFSTFANRLLSVVELGDDDLALLAKMPSSIRHYSSRQRILHKGARSKECCLLLQGYACWQDPEAPNGQITSIHIPGDVPDLGSMHTLSVDADLLALGPTVVAFVPHQFFREIAGKSPLMSTALLRLMLIDAALLRNRIVNLGSCDALTRVAHLLCEIVARLQAVGLDKDFRLHMPFTQSDLASACGITAVHANRTVQALRHRGLLQWHSKVISINDWSGLVRLARFNPDYLHLLPRVAPEARIEPITTPLYYGGHAQTHR
jgi:CRP-like cAMP-binding protein